VAELYWGTTSKFVEHAKQNEVAERLRAAFFDYYGWKPPESEVRSWRNSLKSLSNAIELGELLDHGLLLEFQLPLTSKRLDAMITGHDRDGRPAAVIVELKQWSDDVLPSRVEDMVTVRYGAGKKETLHPSAQVGQYRQYLADAHETFHDGDVQLRACAYLHDFIHDDRSELLAPRHANVLGTYPLFAGVIFGGDLVYRPREGWVGRKEFSYDGGLKRGTGDEDFTRLVKNTYRVLLSRGLKGCYVYFTDEKTRDFFESRIDRLALELAAERAAGYGSEAT
jgi:hypothetical protein